ncbi:AAA family ATPase [Rhodobacter capsulatus]|nr:AAA family ATPase [Rhodobacter capsulatus]
MIPTDVQQLAPWHAVADAIFARIDVPPDLPGPAEAAATAAVSDSIEAQSDPRQMTREELDAWIDEPLVPAPKAPAPPPVRPQMGLRARLLLLRLAAGIGTMDQLAAFSAPAALTVIEGTSWDQARDTVGLLTDHVLPASCVAAGSGARANHRVLRPETSSRPPLSAADAERFAEAIRSSLTHPDPVVILLPIGVTLDPSIMACAPMRIRAAPISSAILAVFWRATVTDLAPEHLADAVAILPPDGHLAGLPETVVLHALRAGDPVTAARRLAAACAQAPGGPCLSDLSPCPAVEAARGLIDGVRAWQSGSAAWSEIEHSLLFYGPPGTGKTWLARALGSEPGVRFVQSSFAEWQSAGHLGNMLAAMRASFAEAVAARPCVLFIDEIDAAGSRDDHDSHNAGYRRQVINGFLEQIDQLNKSGGVLLVGACNNPDALDPAIRRAGRFDRSIEVPLPDRGAIMTMLTAALGSYLSPAEIETLARRGTGLSAAAVDAMIRAGRSRARAAGRDLTIDDLVAHAPGDAPDPAVDWRVAVHEAGHALVAKALGLGRVNRVSITGAGGLTERTRALTQGRLEDLERELTAMMAGRAAERLVLGDVTAGSGGDETSDLAHATRLATAIEAQLGLGEMGPVWYGEADALLLRSPQFFSRVRARLEAAEVQALQTLRPHVGSLRALAARLVVERELGGEELRQALFLPSAPSGVTLIVAEGEEAASCPHPI